MEERLIEVVRGGRMMRGQESGGEVRRGDKRGRMMRGQDGEVIVVILQGGAAHQTR